MNQSEARFHPFHKDGAYHQFKAYVAKKAVIATGDVEKIRLIHEHRFDHDYAMNNLLDDIVMET